MSYYARFEEIDGDMFRFDTRIYLNGPNPDLEPHCVGAVVGINPGSAQPRVLGKHDKLNLCGDKVLPYVRNRFIAAFIDSGFELQANAFVQVLNVFYLCNKDLGKATFRLQQLAKQPICPEEAKSFPLAWYAWGEESDVLAPYKQRFNSRNDKTSFFMNRDRSTFGFGVPGPNAFAKHPRYMPAKPIEEKLASLIRSHSTNSSLSRQ